MKNVLKNCTRIFATTVIVIGLGACGSDGATGQSCSLDSDCNDSNDCTSNTCEEGQCTSIFVFGLSCNDGNPCTENGTCNAKGQCVDSTTIDLESISCQTCTCSVTEGMICTIDAVGSSCDDNNCCTSGDSCQACDPLVDDCEEGQNICQGSLEACDDGNQCTTSECTCTDNEAICSHSNKPEQSPCSFSENDCTEGDACLNGTCAPGPPQNLDDQNPCTKDLCVKGEVEHQPLAEGNCEDGNECTSNDACFLGTCVGGDAVQCELSTCASSAVCVQGEGCVSTWLPEGALCDDGSTCSVGETCDADHICQAEQSGECTDGNDCTNDTCDPDTGECINTVVENGTTCNDGNSCTNNDSCTGNTCGGVLEGCDDGIPCTNDACDPVTGCTHEASNALCDDNDLCTTDTCDPLSGCQFTEVDPSCSVDCENGTLPDNSCCPLDGFCPEEDTTLSGDHTFSVLYIRDGVTVTCVGSEPLHITVSGTAWLNGTLSANGADGADPYQEVLGQCGGHDGGDGSRQSAGAATGLIGLNSFGECENLDAFYKDECWSHIKPQDNYTGNNPCAFLARADGQTGDGPGGGLGGEMSMKIFDTSEGGTGGGGGGSYISAGSAGGMSASVCGLKYGGEAGSTSSSAMQGGSGGGGGGHARNGDCDECSGGSVGAGGDGGAGGGIITLIVTGTLDFNGTITASGGNGGPGTGAPSACTGGGGGGSGGSIYVQPQGLIITEPAGDHFDISGGLGGAPNCINPGTIAPGSLGGEGGDGQWQIIQ